MVPPGQAIDGDTTPAPIYPVVRTDYQQGGSRHTADLSSGRASAADGQLGYLRLPATAQGATGMGVAVLKYRLDEIDRIISRTLAYTIVTGLLAGCTRAWCCWPRGCCR